MSQLEKGPWLTPETAPSFSVLQAWSKPQKFEVAAKFEAMLLHWMKDWSLPNMDSCAAHISASGPWVSGEIESATWMFSAGYNSIIKTCSDSQKSALECRHALLVNLFGACIDESAAPAAAQIADDAWNDWCERLGNLVRADNSKNQNKGKLKRWAGILQIRFPWCGGFWTMDLAAHQVAHLLQPRALDKFPAPQSRNRSEVEPLENAISQKFEQLEVRLTSTVLSVGALRSLAIGDVVTLNHKIDLPLQVFGNGTKAIAIGWLGKRDKSKALQIQPLSENLKEIN